MWDISAYTAAAHETTLNNEIKKKTTKNYTFEQIIPL